MIHRLGQDAQTLAQLEWHVRLPVRHREHTNNTFVGQNEAIKDEMCILIGDSVGTTVPGFCTYTSEVQ